MVEIPSSTSLSQIPTSFATCSIGNGSEHSLPAILAAISSAGFKGIELSYPDLLAFATQHLGHDVGPYDYDDLVTAGKEVKRMCQEDYRLTVLMLQPFANFEGWPEGSQERNDAFRRARGWIEIMQAVGTDMLQVGSSDSPNITSSFDALAADLASLADLLAEHKFRLCYENWCWSTHAPNWLDVWRIVQKADRPNIGLCLDTFQTAGSEWADPSTTSGRIEAGISSVGQLEERFAASLARLQAEVPPERIFLLQISDAYKPRPGPLEDRIVDGLRPRGRWSHDYRPMPYDGGYLPVEKVTKAVLATGFRGWFSLEVFDGGPDATGKNKDDAQAFTKKGMESLVQLLGACV